MNLLKKYGRLLLCIILERQVKKLRNKQKFTIVAVVGSVGKTSTKLAIANVLGSNLRVRYQTGNYNDRLTVPLVIFGHTNPGIFDIKSWMNIIRQNNRQLKSDFPYDVVVLELGTDGPGQIVEFKYLMPEFAVVTAVTPEHMEFFVDIDAVAKEELTVAEFSNKVIVNIDDTEERHLEGIDYISYGFSKGADYRISEPKLQTDLSQKFDLTTPSKSKIGINTKLIGDQGAKIVTASLAIADEMGLSSSVIASSVSDLRAFNGRMNLLEGINKSIIIDDSYNASPAAVIAALNVLYSAKAPQKIAILGNMNELGKTSKDAHIQIGEYCDSNQLDLVITIGPDANKFTAKAAENAGCNVVTFDSPYEAGDYLKNKIDKGAIILVKGSQNRVFAEEAIKPLLKQKSDESKLVRQTEFWLKVKHDQFLRGEVR